MAANHFDNRVAATYDEDKEMFDPQAVEPAVNFLADLAGAGKALEFGIGTGRIALPLARKGVRVHGIDLSQPMIDRLAAKAGAADIQVSLGDFSTTQVGDSFSLVYLLFNTIMNLTTQVEQIACFRNAVSHLGPGGAFVIEVMIPRLQKLPYGEKLVAYDLSDRHWGVDEYDVAAQGLVSHHLRSVNGGIERSSIPFRYVWPSELDLMAELAGMIRRERWGNWTREPFTNLSESHVSVWIKPTRNSE
jgi:SAM-dependent methyltransferase